MRYSLIWCAAALMVSNSLSAQEYVPIRATNPQAGAAGLRQFDPSILHTETFRDRMAVLTGTQDVTTVAADVASPDATAPTATVLPTCNPAPALATIQGGLRYRQSFMSRSAAVQLGILAGSASGSGDAMVVIREYSRGVPCQATDGKTTLMYGQTIRTVIEVSSLDAKANLSLPALAANATISGRNSQVTVEVEGFENPQILTVIAGLAQKELSVETYQDFASAESRLITLAANSATTQSVRRLGIVTEDSDVAMRAAVATAFALYQLSRGSSCSAAQSAFPNPAVNASPAIATVYNSITGTCSGIAPSNQNRQSARDLLSGLEVRR